MKFRGRPPKPRASHAVDGTLRLDRHGTDDQAFNADGAPQRPANLDEHGAAIWDTVVADLQSKRVVARMDTIQLTEMCAWYGRYKRFAQAVDNLGPLDTEVYRLTTLAAMAWKAFDSLAGQFGLNPVARARLRITEAPKSGIAKRKR